MLRLVSNQFSANCEGTSRREFLRVGALGMGGLTLPQLLAAKAANPDLSGKSVVMLNLQGGPTHIETFDPNMDAPSGIRAMFGETKTTLPGITFGSHFPRLAKLAHKLAVVRSYTHGISSHTTAAAHVSAGGNEMDACMAALYAKIAGVTNNKTGVPNNSLIVPAVVGEEFKALSAVPDRITGIGKLSPAFRAFDPSKGGQAIDDMQLNIGDGRFEDRRSLLSSLDNVKRWAEYSDVVSSADQFEQQAIDVILNGASGAFDLSNEDPRTIERYDTGEFKVPARLAKKKGNGKSIPSFSPIALGKQMLLARRLCENGAGFVTVTSTGWDMHGNAFGIDDGMPILGPAVDKAASAFIEDCEERGLSEKILLIITGEFGRTPKINNKGGRDHWGRLNTLAFAGGGLKMGTVVGGSDRGAGEPASDPVSSQQLLGTVMHTLLDVGQVRLRPDLPPELLRILANAKPIPQLI
ncbi:MAG: hypothetical protein ACI8UO_003954 [Verrucomicrobiales bacterium]|jgi:uncharacterized protein (DUF1501 family)